MSIVALQDSRVHGEYRVNSWQAKALFRRYEYCGLLNKNRFTAYFPLRAHVEATWDSIMQRSQNLMEELSYLIPSRHAWASITVWRTTNRGYYGQAMASTEGHWGMVALLRAFLQQLNHVEGCHAQWWFDAGAKIISRKLFAPAVVKKLQENIGLGFCDSQVLYYSLVPLSWFRASMGNISILLYNSRCASGFRELIIQNRGEVYLTTEELHIADIQLSKLDGWYQTAGFRRFRVILLAYLYEEGAPVGAAIIHRGPVGINLSCMENCVDLILDSKLHDHIYNQVFLSLMEATTKYYADFPAQAIPVVTDERASAFLSGKAFIRFSITADGSQAVYNHYRKLLQQRVALLERRSVTIPEGEQS